MDTDKIMALTGELQEKYPDVGIEKIEVDSSTGKSSFYIRPTRKSLAFLDKTSVMPKMAKAATINRQYLDRTSLELITTKSPYEDDPKNIFSRSIKYYYESDFYGSTIDILTNFAAKGFENDIDDENIKLFYDVWCLDVNFRQVLNWIFFDLFRVGMVRTYKIVGKYEPGITNLSPAPGTKVEKGILRNIINQANTRNERRLKAIDAKLSQLDARKIDEKYLKEELAAKKRVWSKGYMPISYTVLNPTLVTIEGSLLFDKSRVTLQPSTELKALLKKPTSELTDDEKEIIKLLPSDFKSAIKGGGNIPLDPMFVGSVDYRKMPYERYAKPRGIKAFDSIEYKRALREADLSTLDGISNYILKVTVGNDEYPVVDNTQLESVAALFNTPSKSFDVVWNHTLNIEKIVSPEIGDILGQDKYAQVNDDLTGALAFSRALVDGSGSVSPASVALLTKTIIEEVNYGREQVSRWIYEEYQQIAEAAGFDRFPKVRWDNTVLKDIILYMSTISQLVDRRMLSYETALEQLGFDYDNEFANMEREFPSVMEGILGIVGSPFQKSATQPTQGAPSGTPSSGRPKGQPSKTKQPSTNPSTKTKVPNQAPSNQPKAKSASLGDVIKSMSNEEFESFYQAIHDMRNEDNL